MTTQFSLFAPDPSPHRDPSAAGAPRGGDTVNNRRVEEGFYRCSVTTCRTTGRAAATHYLISAHYGTHTPVCLACGRAMIAEYDAKLPDDPRFRYRLQAMTPEQFAGRQPWKALDDAPEIE